MSGPWPEGTRCGVAFSVDFDGPTPYVWAHRGEDRRVLGELEQRRFGPRRGVWRVLEMLERLDLKASFYVPGMMAISHPDAVEAMLSAGHEVGLHGHEHEPVQDLEGEAVTEVMDRSLAALEAAGATGPFGYRSPSWEMTDEAWQALKAVPVTYDSSLMGSDLPYLVDGLLEVPVDWAVDDAVFYRYVPGSNRPPVAPQALTDAWALEIEAAKRYETLLVITIHPWISGRPARALALEKLLERFLGDPDIWWATVGEVAGRFTDTPSLLEVPKLHTGHDTP